MSPLAHVRTHAARFNSHKHLLCDVYGPERYVSLLERIEHLHTPFITIIEVIKVEHLQAKCNIVPAGIFFLLLLLLLFFYFYGLVLPWCLSILVSRLCVTLIPVTAFPQLYPQAAFSLPPSCVAVAGEQGHLSLPLIYIYFPCQPYLLGHFAFGTHLFGNHKAFCGTLAFGRASCSRRSVAVTVMGTALCCIISSQQTADFIYNGNCIKMQKMFIHGLKLCEHKTTVGPDRRYTSV